MGLGPGTRVGAYEITSLLGRGGMGEVYRARDDRLGRDVALKVLPDAFASDPDRVARFEREARILASLTHANIAAIYGVEEGQFEEGRHVRALVLELVEGETLADRLTRGRLPLDEALPMARQIADALEAAHEQGIIHRDLKPANIKLAPNGVVKVLDFGLARLTDGAPTTESAGVSTQPLAALSMSPTIAAPGGTAVGIILGTAAYMSPEQAKGRPADRRSDMWAFGCVLYELLTGRPVFTGDDVSETLAEVIKSQVAWEMLPADTPAALRRLLRRCLVKDPKARLADAGVARLEIDEAAQPESSFAAESAPAASRSAVRRYAPAIAGVLFGAALMGLFAFARNPGDSMTPVVTTRFGLAAPAGVRLPPNASQRVAISRDGRRIFYVGASGGTERFYVHHLDRLEPTAVPGVEGDLGSIFLSPDGEWIGYNDPRRGSFKKVRTTGGAPTTICDVPTATGGFGGVTWGSNGTLVFATANNPSLMQVSDSGGTPAPLTRPDGERHRQPYFLPDGHGLLFTVSKPGEPDRIAALSLASGSWKVLTQGSSPRYSPSGHLVFLRENVLWAMAFDVRTLETSGNAVPVLEDVGTQLTTALFDIASNRTMVFVPAASEVELYSLAWVDRNGREEAIPAPARAYQSIRLSPDGSALALDAWDQERDVWIWHLMRRTLMRLTFDRATDRSPVWTPDGRRIVFTSDRERGNAVLFSQAADGTGTAERLVEGDGPQVASGVTPDGMFALFADQRDGPADLLAVALGNPPFDRAPGTSREVRTLVKTTFAERNGVVSPDGRWLAYESNTSGDFEIYVRPYPQTASGQWQVSAGGGIRPVWSRDSRALFFIADGTIMETTVPAGSTWAAHVPRPAIKDPAAVDGAPRVALPTISRAVNLVYPFDVSVDGKRFVVLKDEARQSKSVAPAIVVVQNWGEELKRLLK